MITDTQDYKEIILYILSIDVNQTGQIGVLGTAGARDGAD